MRGVGTERRIPSLPGSLAAWATALLATGCTSPAEPARPSPSPVAVAFPLATMPVMPDRAPAAAAFVRRHPVFEHQPFESAGFNAISLPIRFVADAPGGEPARAQAMAFLLSFALDWAPGSYNTRHAYFCFKRSREMMRPLASGYDAGTIARLVREWGGTHAVGGLVRWDGAGYAGRLEIHDATGREVFRRDHVESRGFFDLLGDFAADSLTFFGHPPSPALSAHLRTPRCGHAASLTDLGEAAFLEERGAEEFGLYRAILERDPGFAEVRYWLANQSFWANRDRERYMLEAARAMEAHLLAPPLGDFEPARCPDPTLAGRYAAWVDRAAALIGEGSPQVVRGRLELARIDGVPLPPERLEDATAVASRYPNEYWLLQDLGHAWAAGGDLGPADPVMAMGIHMAAYGDRYLTAFGDRDESIEALASDAYEAGEPAVARSLIGLLSAGAPQARDWSFHRWSSLGRYLAEMGRHEESADAFVRAAEIGEVATELLGQAWLQAGVGYALVGRKEAVQDILARHESELAAATGGGTLRAYAALLDGTRLTYRDVAGIAVAREPTVMLHRVLLCSQVDRMNGTREGRNELLTFMAFMPWDRRIWCLYDAYERHTPTLRGHGFYATLEWFFPDEPWVAEAVADHRRRTAPRPPIDYAQIDAWLAAFGTQRWPQPVPGKKDAAELLMMARLPPTEFVLAVRGLVEQGRRDAAMDMALRFHDAAVNARLYQARALANRTIHRLRSLGAASP